MRTAKARILGIIWWVFLVGLVSIYCFTLYLDHRIEAQVNKDASGLLDVSLELFPDSDKRFVDVRIDEEGLLSVSKRLSINANMELNRFPSIVLLLYLAGSLLYFRLLKPNDDVSIPN